MTSRDGPIEVPAALAGVRVDRAVAMLAGLTRARAAELVAIGGVALGGEAVQEGSRRLRAGETLAISLSSLAAEVAGEPVPSPSPAVPFKVIHEDSEIVVVDKPAGVVVHPGAGNRRETLISGLLARYPELALLPAAGAGETDRPGIVHRLDKETSGVLVVARTPAAYRALTAQLANRQMGRTYLAVVLGHLDGRHGVIDAPIGRSSRDRTAMAVSATGRHARTAYRVREHLDGPFRASYLELDLETGRTHQIRVHLAAIGHPVLGDRRYGGTRGAVAVKRCLLHAWKLRLEHPVTGEEVSYVAPVPDDLSEALSRFIR